MENRGTKLDTVTTAQTDANTVLVAVRKRGGDNGKRKCLIGEYGEKICQCTKPRQSPFPDGKIICLRCWGEWYH